MEAETPPLVPQALDVPDPTPAGLPVPLLPPIPSDPAEALVMLRENGIRVWLDDEMLRIGPTWRVPPAALERLLPIAGSLATLVRAEIAVRFAYRLT